jgi:hypothetical protein
MLYAVDSAAPSGRRSFCPACYIGIDCDSVEVDRGVRLHTHPCCIQAWFGLRDDDRLRRTDEARRMSVAASWTQWPDGVGAYWVAHEDCGVPVPAVVVLQGSELVVQSHRREAPVPVHEYNDYRFMKKAA